jgi:endo-1,4-beta-D-glucanase Y
VKGGDRQPRGRRVASQSGVCTYTHPILVMMSRAALDSTTMPERVLSHPGENHLENPVHKAPLTLAYPFVLAGCCGLAACASSAGGPTGETGGRDAGGSSSGSSTGSSSGSGADGGGSGAGSSSSGGSSGSGSGGASSSGSSGGGVDGGSSGGGDSWLSTPTPANASGNFPFPQDRRSPNCTYPMTISHARIAAAYQAWLSSMVTSSGAPGGALRVQDPMTGNQTTSEGMAYGMLIAVYMADRKTFDSLWQYVQGHISSGLMNWQVTAAGGSTGGMTNSAADADEDMAWALVMADKQWPAGSYLGAAKTLLMNIKSQEINASNNVKDGNFPNAGSTHPDYAAPDYYKVFATVSNDSSWNAVTTAEYAQLTGAQNASTGLIPDAIGGSTFGYDACRAPWRVGLDYCWSGSAASKSFLTPMVSYFMQVSQSGSSVSSIKIPVPTSGGTGQFSSGAITGPAAVSALMSASNQTLVNGSWNYLYSLVSSASNPGSANYFSATLGMISLLALSGNFIDYTNPP